MKLNQLYKLNSTRQIIYNARKYFGDDVTLSNEKINRRWVDKPIEELLMDLYRKIPPSRNRDSIAMDILREIFVTTRDDIGEQ